MSSNSFQRRDYIDTSHEPPRLLYDTYESYLTAHTTAQPKRRSYHEMTPTTIPETIHAYVLPARTTTAQTKTIILSAGVHGHEAFGPTVLAEFMTNFTDNPLYKDRHQDYHFIFFPALNPGGLRQCTDHNILGQNTNRFVISKKDNAWNHVPHIDSLTTLWKKIKKDNFLTDIMLALDLHGARAKDGFFAVTPSAKHIDRIKLDSHITIIKNCFDIHSKNFPSYNPWNTLWYPLDIASSRNPQKPSYTMPCPGVAISLNYGTHKDFFIQQWAHYAYTLEYPWICYYDERQKGFLELVEQTISSCISFTKS